MFYRNLERIKGLTSNKYLRKEVETIKGKLYDITLRLVLTSDIDDNKTLFLYMRDFTDEVKAYYSEITEDYLIEIGGNFFDVDGHVGRDYVSDYEYSIISDVDVIKSYFSPYFNNN